jgi:hypothetical protein
MERQLFKKERIAIRLGHNLLGQRIAQAIRGKDRANHLNAVVMGQGLQCDLPGIRPPGPRRTVAGAIGREQEDSRAREALGRGCDELFGNIVDPVQIFEHQNGWVSLAALDAQLTKNFEGLFFDRLGV